MKRIDFKLKIFADKKGEVSGSYWYTCMLCCSRTVRMARITIACIILVIALSVAESVSGQEACPTSTPNLCKNGASCLVYPNSTVVCVCSPEYQGMFCEMSTDPPPMSGDMAYDSYPCDPNPCKNNGICYVASGEDQESCDCTGTGYRGQQCTDELMPPQMPPVDPCESNPCLNEGICDSTTDGLSYKCDCRGTGYTGNRCEDSVNGNDDSVTDNPAQLSQTTVIIIAVAAGVLVLFIFVLIVTVCCYCRRKRGQEQRGAQEERAMKTMFEYEANPATKYESKYSTKNKRSYNRDNLSFYEQLGTGAFAVVYRAKAKNIMKKGVETEVAVKMLKEMSTEDDKLNFLKEVEMYKNLKSHPNIIGMLGSCVEKEPYYIIMEYAKEGSLDSHLKKIRKDINPTYTNQLPSSINHKFLTPNEIMTFAIQIARGMAHLASQKCVHRDLATRNILLGEGLVCKVSDFGLARDVNEASIYEMKTRGRVPVRWMAIESLLDNIYTTQSDVWSYGILLWELVTIGSHPYPGMSGGKVIAELKKGYRLPKPEHCSEEMYNIMRSCWDGKPDDRPTFIQLRNQLEHMLEDAQGYLDMSDFKERDYIYLRPDQHSLDSQPELDV